MPTTSVSLALPQALEVSPELALPIDSVTETFWWLGIRGSGKTHDCSVFVEEMLAQQAQVIILDPMHAWWGLRTSADGADAGYPVPIFGGPRGDVPLEPTAGRFMANLAIDERVSMILDVKRWSKADRRRFVTAFLERLLEANDRSPVHVVLEEAPLFAPQRPQRDETVMLGVVEELVRLGRGEGIGCSLISQRSATINKEVSTQTEVLVAHRVRSPQDVDAVKAWFEVHDPTKSKEAAQRLPHLGTGTAIVSSTSFLELFDEVTFRPRRTFDSSSTPKVGQTRREARTLADVDLDAVKVAMAETIERAEASDPKALQRRIRELEAHACEVPTPEQVEVTVERVPAEVLAELSGVREELERLRERVEHAMGVAEAYDQVEAPKPKPLIPAFIAPPRARPSSAPHVPLERTTPRQEHELSAYARHLLTALAARHPLPLKTRQWSVAADRSTTSSGWDPAVRQLRTAGLVVRDDDEWSLTNAGIDEAGVVETAAPPSGEELVRWWCDRITGPSAGAAKTALRTLFENPPMSQNDLADLVGWSRTSSGPGAAVGILVKLGLAHREDGLIHLDEQFR